MTHLEALRDMLDEAGIVYEYGEDTDSELCWVRIEENGHESPPLNPSPFFTVFTFHLDGKLAKVGVWS